MPERTPRTRPVTPGSADGSYRPGTGGSPPARVPPQQPEDAPEAPGQDSDEPLAKVIPLGIFDPFEEAKKPW